MRNISFMLTTQQVRERTKTVTRRIGWEKLKGDELLCGVEKGMGLKAGETVVRLATIQVLTARREPLRAMTDNLEYGIAECIKEGFGEHPTLRWPSAFVEFFCRSHRGCTPDTILTRIEFGYVGSPQDAGAGGDEYEKPYIVEHPDSDEPPPRFASWDEALSAQVRFNREFSGHKARRDL